MRSKEYISVRDLNWCQIDILNIDKFYHDYGSKSFTLVEFLDLEKVSLSVKQKVCFYYLNDSQVKKINNRLINLIKEVVNESTNNLRSI